VKLGSGKLTSEAQARAVLRKAGELKALSQVNALAREHKPLDPERWKYFLGLTRNHSLGEDHVGQVKFLQDPARFKALLCPRRTGKSTVTILSALKFAEEFPGSTVAYVVPDSKGHARRLFWRPLKKINLALKLGLTFYEVDKRVTHPNGTDILLFGAHDKDSDRQFRGDAYALVILDECKDFGPHFEQLVEESIVPALRDHQGTLIMAGTPGDILHGLFYKVTSGQLPDWSVHHWNMSVNPFLPPQERDLDTVWRTSYAPFGITKDNPRFRREILAEWCTNDSERVYAYDNIRNNWDGVLPPGPHQWMFCLGLDLGERDANAFVVGAFAPTCRHLYIVDQYARARMSIDELAAKYRELEAKWGTFAFATADTGGYGRGIVTELQNKHDLPLTPADKGKNKLGNIAMMNNDFINGRIKCPKDSPLAAEWLKLARRVRTSDGKVLLDHTDLGDAALYMHRASLHWTGTDPDVAPLPGTQEYWRKLELDAINRVVANRNNRTKALSERD
jgi:hypothetical protein